MSKTRTPVAGDRWQNRANDRVAVVEDASALDVGVLWCRYEQRTPNARATRRQAIGVREFMTKFTPWEPAAPSGGGSEKLMSEKPNRMKQTEGELITLDWYDGPLCQVQRIDFEDHDPLVQVRSLGYAEGTYPRTMHVIRLDRATLQAALDLLDGKPVKGCDE